MIPHCDGGPHTSAFLRADDTLTAAGEIFSCFNLDHFGAHRVCNMCTSQCWKKATHFALYSVLTRALCCVHTIFFICASTCTRTHTSARTHIHTHTHAQARTRTHARTHTHTHCACTHGHIKRVNARYVNSTRGTSSVLRMYLWWSLCTKYLHACQVRVTVGDSDLCCCTCVTYFER